MLARLVWILRSCAWCVCVHEQRSSFVYQHYLGIHYSFSIFLLYFKGQEDEVILWKCQEFPLLYYIYSYHRPFWPDLLGGLSARSVYTCTCNPANTGIVHCAVNRPDCPAIHSGVMWSLMKSRTCLSAMDFVWHGTHFSGWCIHFTGCCI